ncbi:uncharacterized protein TNCV_1591631 [Trichonephila clavipes]|nr:uncharacterized protein TNCV_1591631 [Trichonephila clavipes]
MSSVGYSSSPVHWSRWSRFMLAWHQSEKASSAARPSQWRYTPKKSCPVVRRKRATASVLYRRLRIGPTVPRVSKRLLVLWGHGSIFSMYGDIMFF